MNTILLLINNARDRRLLGTCLKGRYRIIMPEKDEGLDDGFDLCVADGLFLKHKYDAVAARKEAEKEVFLPVLLVTAKKEVGLWNPGIRQIIDEMIFRPIQEMELHMRVASLLRTRQISTQMKHHKEIHPPKDCQHLIESEARGRSLVFDVTEQKQTQDALRISEERLRLSTEMAHVAVWEYDFPQTHGP